jgi:hypothetical protein
MPILVQPVLDTKLRIWFHRLAGIRLRATGKSTLCQYLSTIDRIVPLSTDLLQRAIPLAAKYDGCSKEEIENALCDIVEGSAAARDAATKAVHVLEALVARIARGSDAPDRVRVAASALHVLDFLNEWFKGCASQPDRRCQGQLGGAPAVMAQAVTRLEVAGHQATPGSARPKVALWTFYHSKRQASVFDSIVEFLQIEEQCVFSTIRAIDAGREGDPEVVNYSIEFEKDFRLELHSSRYGACTVTAGCSDRVIAIAPGYRFYNKDGSVDRGRVPRSVPLHLVAADPWRGPSCVVEVAQDYKYWIIGGVQGVSDAVAQQSLAGDLQRIPPEVTLHVEIAGPSPSPWFVDMLRKYVNSAGVNIDDIVKLTQMIAESNPDLPPRPVASPAPDVMRDYRLRLAFWLLCALDLERVYVHGLELDFVARRHASDGDMSREVTGDLLAKNATANRARGVHPAGRPASTFGFSTSTLEAFVEVCAQRAYPVKNSWATREGQSEFEAILDCGWFGDTFDYGGELVSCRVAIVPVGLFRVPPCGLRFVGAGDTTSAVSFVFGCFTTRGLKRGAQLFLGPAAAALPHGDC